MDRYSIKSQVFNLIRGIFKIPFFERLLIGVVGGKTSSSFLYRLIPHRDTYSYTEYRIFKRNGIHIKVSLRDYLGHCLYFNYHNAELDSYDIMLKLIRNNSICIDVGSNNGFISLAMANIAKNGYVYGFEPDPFNYNNAKENLALNNLTNVEICNMGLGDSVSEATMDIQTIENRGKNRVAAASGLKGDLIRIITLDGFLLEKGVTYITFLKVDVEGYEMKVLRGATNILKKCKPVLFIEIDEHNLNYHGDKAVQLIQFLLSIGYDRLLNAQTGLKIEINSNFEGLHFDLLAISSLVSKSLEE